MMYPSYPLYTPSGVWQSTLISIPLVRLCTLLSRVQADIETAPTAQRRSLFHDLNKSEGDDVVLIGGYHLWLEFSRD